MAVVSTSSLAESIASGGSARVTAWSIRSRCCRMTAASRRSPKVLRCQYFRGTAVGNGQHHRWCNHRGKTAVAVDQPARSDPSEEFRRGGTCAIVIEHRPSQVSMAVSASPAACPRRTIGRCGHEFLQQRPPLVSLPVADGEFTTRTSAGDVHDRRRRPTAVQLRLVPSSGRRV